MLQEPQPTPMAAAPAAPAADAQPAEEKPAEPFAFADFTWLNGNNRQKKAILDTPYFTPEILFDVNYTASTNNPIDHTVVGSTALSRNNEFTLAFMGFGGDLHYENARGRIMTQFGVRSTLVPRNDLSTNHGQYDLQTALRYVSEAYGGVHINKMNGINIDAGIFMSYVGLFSYDNFENWMYLPSFTSDNTPWFFNGIRVQMFTSDKLKIEPWLINGWQTYGKFNEMPGFGAQILWRPAEWVSVLSNDYVGWDTQNHPGRMRVHSDNSVQFRYFDETKDTSGFHRAAISITGDIGFEHGGGVTPFGGSGVEWISPGVSGCTTATPCTQNFLSWMVYNRMWFFDGHMAWNVGGGMMHNPGRYLVLSPTGVATMAGVSPSIGASGVPTQPTQAYDNNPGTKFDAYDYETGIQYMPNEQVTFDLEFNSRHSKDPYFAGHGGVTSPDGYTSTAPPPGWRPDLVKSDNRIIAAMLTRF
jgi:opacity protein-like surface antigen